MMNATKEEQQRGYRTEFELAALLNRAGYFVKPVKAKRGARVPLVKVNGELVRAVDLLVRRDGREWRLEVKSLTPRGESASPTYIISSAQLADYVMQERSWKASSEAGAAADNGGVYVVVKDATATANHLGSWRFIEPSEIEKHGTREVHTFAGSPEAEFVRWPRERMGPLSELLPQIDGTIASPPVTFETIVLGQSNSSTATRTGGPLHSLVGTFDELGGIEAIQKWIERGIKVACFCNDAEGDECKALLAAMKGRSNWKEAKLFSFHTISEESTLLFEDGVAKEGTLGDLKVRSEAARPPFNFEQFEVEHAPADQHIIVKAGAGSGKTTVMLERLLFLLATQPHLNPANLGLITFTRKATKEMRDRLGRLLVGRLSIAVQDSARFRTWLVSSNDLNIQTIAAYCNGLIGRYGKSLGLASGTTLRSLTTKRREELRYALRMAQERQHTDLGRPDYQFLQLALDFWTRMDNLSTEMPLNAVGTAVELQTVFSQQPRQPAVPDAGSKGVASLLFTIIANAKRRLDNWKEREAVIELADLSKIAERLDLAELFRGERGLRFLMIDEFQDTDNAQISLVAKMIQAAGANSSFRLFCVGDTKQAIYRFRGAEYTAFHMLSEQLDLAGLQPNWFTLQRNYRTDPRLLEQLEKRYFAPWKAPNKDWLPADPPPLGAEENRDSLWSDMALLRSEDVNLPPDHPAFLETCASKVLDFLSDPRISTCKVSKIEDSNEGTRYAIVNLETVTILTRTNRQAKEIQIAIQKLVEERQDQLRPVRDLCWLNDIEAGLFEEENAIAARSLLALLRWLASPQEVESHFNLMATGWTQRYVDWRVAENLLLSERDDHRQTLQGILQKVRSEFEEAQVRSQSMPTPALLAWAVDFYRIAERANELTDPKDAFRRQQFLGNLRLVIAHLVADTSDQQWTVAGCIDWLEMKLATEASSSSKTPAWRPVTEEQRETWSTTAPTDVELSKVPLRVQAMTAHKAKGLEFKHVVLPCLHHAIFVGSDGLFAPAQGSAQPRWQFKFEPPKRKILSAPNIEQAELKEVMKEEARLLYVALTRAKKTILLVHGTSSDDERSWATPFLLNQP